MNSEKRSNQKREPIDLTEVIRQELGVAPREFSTMLGFTDSVYPRYIDMGELPVTAALAARALYREWQDKQPKKNGPSSAPKYILLRLTSNDTGPVIQTLDVGPHVKQMVFEGTPYLLVPVPIES